MKKHELLEKAMRDYPAGTVFTWGGYESTSTGIFRFDGDDIVDSNDMAVMDMNKDWAGIIHKSVAPSILSGKCAIQVNNEREFNLLMEHYESKGLRMSGTKDGIGSIKGGYPQVKYYDDSYNGQSNGKNSKKQAENEGYQVIDFPQFAAEVGIPLPVFVMTSEDNVPLYKGDDYYRAGRSGSQGKGDFVLFETKGLRGCHFVCSYPEIDKAFSSKEAAEAWIKEQNNPKAIEVKLFKGKTANVHSDLIRVFDGNNTMNFAPSDLEDLLHAYKSLQ